MRRWTEPHTDLSSAVRCTSRPLSPVLTASVRRCFCPVCDRPSASRPVPSRQSRLQPPLEAVLTGRNGSGRARTVANRAKAALTGAVRTGLSSCTVSPLPGCSSPGAAERPVREHAGDGAAPATLLLLLHIRPDADHPAAAQHHARVPPGRWERRSRLVPGQRPRPGPPPVPGWDPHLCPVCHSRSCWISQHGIM